MIRQTLDSVKLEPRTPALAWILLVLMADPEPLVLTSAGDSTHHTHSAHYRGEAVDVRSHDLATMADKRARCTRLIRALGPGFTVLLEPYDVNGSDAAEHIHIQVKKGESYQAVFLQVDVTKRWIYPPVQPAPPLVS